MRYDIYCYADENGDNLVKVEGAKTEAEAFERADELFDNYERVEIIDNKNDAEDGFNKVAEDLINYYNEAREGLNNGTLRLI